MQSNTSTEVHNSRGADGDGGWGDGRVVGAYKGVAVLPETVVGSGNKASELTVTQALLQELYPLLDPNAQRIILRRRYTALTDNPDEAMAAVPEAPGAVAQEDQQYAQFAFTILMEGLPFMDKEGVNHVVMGATLMQLAGAALQQAQAVAQQPSGIAIAAQKVAGVSNVLAHVQQEVQKVAQAPALKMAAKALMKQFEVLNGQLQQVAKQVQASEEQQSQSMNPEMAKLQAKLADIQATGDLQRNLAAKAADQKLQQRQVQWLSTTQQKEADTAADNKRKDVETVAGIHRAHVETAVDLHNKVVQAHADAAISRLQAEQEAANAGGSE